jgi:hypothetical protein
VAIAARAQGRLDMPSRLALRLPGDRGARNRIGPSTRR